MGCLGERRREQPCPGSSRVLRTKEQRVTGHLKNIRRFAKRELNRTKPINALRREKQVASDDAAIGNLGRQLASSDPAKVFMIIYDCVSPHENRKFETCWPSTGFENRRLLLVVKDALQRKKVAVIKPQKVSACSDHV